MHTIIRDNYGPTPNEYHETIVVDEARGKRWLFDCDGVFHDITKINVVSERGDSEEYAASQKWVTEEVQALQGNLDAEEAARIAADEALQDNIDSEEADRIAADREIWGEIEALEAASDVVDIVGTYAELEDYDTSALNNNDIIKVLQDETHDDATAYYRWNTTTGTFTFVGVEGPYYTASETDTLLAGKQDKLIAGINIQIAADGKTISAISSDVPIATTSVAGKVKPDGTTITVAADGTISSSAAYTLPPATTTTLGGIIVGNNLTVDANGVLNATGTAYTAGAGLQLTGTTFSVDNTIATKSELTNGLASKQDTLTAGTGISIDANNVISSTATATLYGTTGQNTDGAMTQKAATDMVFIAGKDPSTSSTDVRVAIGNTSSALDAVSIGRQASASGSYAIAIGFSANAASQGVSIGNGTYSGSGRSVVIGGHATDENGIGNVLLGFYSAVDDAVSYSAALGAYSVVDTDYTVSVGSGNPSHSATYQYRRIVNVADAVNAHDAVTKGQLDTVVASIPTTNNISSTDWNALWQ